MRQMYTHEAMRESSMQQEGTALTERGSGEWGGGGREGRCKCLEYLPARHHHPLQHPAQEEEVSQNGTNII